jgi:hypothetical protein
LLAPRHHPPASATGNALARLQRLVDHDLNGLSTGGGDDGGYDCTPASRR